MQFGTASSWLRSSSPTTTGIVEGFNATHFADAPGMKVATAGQLLYGFSAAAAHGRCGHRAGPLPVRASVGVGERCPPPPGARCPGWIGICIHSRC
jgi:hypothetical protein